MLVSIASTGSAVKVGDLVRVKFTARIGEADLSGKAGIITEISEPTPVLPYQVVTVAFEDGVYDGIISGILEVISEVDDLTG